MTSFRAAIWRVIRFARKPPLLSADQMNSLLIHWGLNRGLMSASAPLTSTIMTMFGLARLAFVASRKGYQVFSRVLATAVWLVIALNYLL